MERRENIFKSDSEKLLMLVFIIVMSLMLPGCPFEGKLKSFNDMTPKEKAVWMMSVYNAQYDDYLKRVKAGLKTESEKNILRTKKKVLTKVYPMIKMYNAYIETGSLPEKETEDLIFDLINQIVTM